MEKRARMVLLATAAVLAGLLLRAWKTRTPEAEPVQAGTATVQDIYNSVTMSGTVEAAETTVLCPAQTALVAAVYASEGDRVEQGDILCALAGAPQYSGVENVQAAWNAVAGGAAHTVLAEETGVLRAPASGCILEIPSAGETVFSGLPCIRIADMSRLQVRAQSPELYAGELQAGQRANITAAGAGEKAYGALVERVAPVAEQALSLTGQAGETTVETILTLPGRTDGLRPGYSATVKIFTDHHPEAVVVPHEAVCQRGEQEYVFCIRDGRAVQCAVSTGYMLETVTEIRDGITPGETVILSPSEELKDGAPVRVAA